MTRGGLEMPGWPWKGCGHCSSPLASGATLTPQSCHRYTQKESLLYLGGIHPQSWDTLVYVGNDIIPNAQVIKGSIPTPFQYLSNISSKGNYAMSLNKWGTSVPLPCSSLWDLSLWFPVRLNNKTAATGASTPPWYCSPLIKTSFSQLTYPLKL